MKKQVDDIDDCLDLEKPENELTTFRHGMTLLSLLMKIKKIDSHEELAIKKLIADFEHRMGIIIHATSQNVLAEMLQSESDMYRMIQDETINTIQANKIAAKIKKHGRRSLNAKVKSDINHKAINLADQEMSAITESDISEAEKNYCLIMRPLLKFAAQEQTVEVWKSYLNEYLNAITQILLEMTPNPNEISIKQSGTRESFAYWVECTSHPTPEQIEEKEEANPKKTKRKK